jgi:CBS domain-containing protein
MASTNGAVSTPVDASRDTRASGDVATTVAPARGFISDGGLGPAGRPVRTVMRPIVWCDATDRIRDVAHRIGEAADSCALVRAQTGLAIVTDHDFRHRVATGEVSVDAPIADVAAAPVISIDENATLAAGLLRMVEHGVHHLVVTDMIGQPVGVVRVADLARTEVRDPLLIRSAIDSARTLEALVEAGRSLPATVAELRAQGVPARHVGAVQAAVVDAIVLRALAVCGHPIFDQVRHSWILLGSIARREPLPRSDLDTALMWADSDPSTSDPADDLRTAAGHVLDYLTQCGLDPCPDGANATNPQFSRSQSAWTAASQDWMHEPNRQHALLLSAMVADSRPLTEVDLGRHLTDTIRSHTRTSQFLRALLDEALAWRPPIGLIREFVVQHRGPHHGQVDLKRGGLSPIVALGRWIAIVTGDARGTTPERLVRGSAAGLLIEDEQKTLVVGFDNIYTLLYDRELQAIRSGDAPTTFVRPRDLDSLSRRHLRETLRAIARVQARVDLDWIHRLSG